MATWAAPTPPETRADSVAVVVAPVLVKVTVLTAEAWPTNTEPKLTEAGLAERPGPVMMVPENDATAFPPALDTVNVPDTEAAAAPADGVSSRPILQVSPLLRLFAAQVLLEIVTFALLTAGVSVPDAVVDELVTVKMTSVPVPPGATDPRSGPPVIDRLVWRVGVPVKATVDEEAPVPLSVIVRVAVSDAVMLAAGA
jgi:hypothetical protein